MNKNLNKLIVIGGPTAVGKSQIALYLAEELGAEIINADSRQVYRQMQIGTAKPSEIDQSRIRHHLVGHVNIWDEYSVGDFEKEGLQAINSILLSKKPIILVGGSGFYIKALFEGLDYFPKISKEVKLDVEKTYKLSGLEAIQKEILDIDPKFMSKIDIKNPHRLLRALGIIRASGRPFSDFQSGEKAKRKFQGHFIALHKDRHVLYQRINDRVDSMLKAGLLDEVKSLKKYQHLKSLQTVGYRELFDYFDGHIELDASIELVKRNTRRYAKRQITWFKNQQPSTGSWNYFLANDYKQILHSCTQALNLK